MSMTYWIHSIPLEVADVYSLFIANVLTVIYYLGSRQHVAQVILLTCVTVWSTRLATFLSTRAMHGFHDDRLNSMRKTARGAVTWYFAQTMWMFLTFFPVWIGMCSSKICESRRPLNVIDGVAVAFFFIAFVSSALAAAQKAIFLVASHEKEGKSLYDKGLFSFCRFPNYFAEWVMWCSLSLLAFQSSDPARRWLLPVCPIFLYYFFHGVSIPMAIASMRRRLDAEQYASWSRIPLFFPGRRKLASD